jgi:YVTN family beta-propeller protein
MAPQGKACGHYTQVIWSASTSVGCGKATGTAGSTYVVCNFYPPGNYEATLPYAVTATTTTAVSIAALANADAYTFVSQSNQDSKVWMIDVTTGKTVAQIDQEGFLSAVDAAKGDVHYEVDSDNNQVLVFRNKRLDAQIPVGIQPAGLVLSLDETQLFVLDIVSNNLEVIDTSTKQVVATGPAPENHFGITMTSNGQNIEQVK